VKEPTVADGIERLRDAAEHAETKEKAQADHRLRIRMELLSHGVLVVVRRDDEIKSLATENRKLVTWIEVTHAHINVLTKRMDEMLAQMLGERV
jgi:cell division protein FtsB